MMRAVVHPLSFLGKTAPSAARACYNTCVSVVYPGVRPYKSGQSQEAVLRLQRLHRHCTTTTTTVDGGAVHKKYHTSLPPPFLPAARVHHYQYHQSRRYFSTNHKPQIVLQKFGDLPYGSREYRLVFQRPPNAEDDTTTTTTTTSDGTMVEQPVASLRAHRNIIFGAQLFTMSSAGKPPAKTPKLLQEVCLPLLDAALEDASQDGEQPQAMATLHGLCDYVTTCIHAYEEILPNENGTIDHHHHPPKLKDISEVLYQIVAGKFDDHHSDEPSSSPSLESPTYQAIRAIATGLPRPGHSAVGQGTYRDGEAAWLALAQEFATRTDSRRRSSEVALYQARGATLVQMEHLADAQPAYLKSAGGTMARLFFW